jgi:thioredoxin 1
MSAELVLTAENFKEEVLDSSLPVLVDFWAEWCMPCKMIAPSIDQIAEKYKGQVIVGKVDVDAQVDLAQRYNIISIPTLIVFKGGKLHTQKVGALPKHEIENLLKSAL